MKEKTMGSVNISGAGSSGGGTFDSVSISGAGKILGEVEANEIRVSGSGKFTSHVRAKTFKSSGSSVVEGNVTAETFKASGASDIHGDLDAGTFDAPGSSKIGGRVKAREFRSSGIVKVAGNVHADTMHLTGVEEFHADVEATHFQSASALTIGGLLNGDTVDIVLVGAVTIREIGGEHITVVHPGERGTAGWLLPSYTHTLTAEVIEGDDLYLESTSATTVRGRRVVIGPNCRIKTVEFSESLQIDPTATVEQHSYTGRNTTPTIGRNNAEAPAGWARQQAQQMNFTSGINFANWRNPLVAILMGTVGIIVALFVIFLITALVIPTIGIVLGVVFSLLVFLLLAIPVLLLVALILKGLGLPIERYFHIRWRR